MNASKLCLIFNAIDCGTLRFSGVVAQKDGIGNGQGWGSSGGTIGFDRCAGTGSGCGSAPGCGFGNGSGSGTNGLILE
jgi:hypothetical protein